MYFTSFVAACWTTRTLRTTCNSVFAAALFFASLATQQAGAQTLAWSASLYAQVPPWQIVLFGEGPGGTLTDTPFMPDWDADSRSVMLLSDAGAPGIVLAGRAQIDDSFQTQPPGTPWLVKIARDDGALLWTWHLDDYAEGYFAEAITDPSGDIIAIGTQWFPNGLFGSLVVKLDGATGALRWRVDGPAEQYFGLGIALDADGNVLATSSHDRIRQDVSKYARDTGALLWSSGMSESADWDDGLVRVDADGDVVAAGAYELSDNGQVLEDGIQIAKFRGTDGHVLWSRRFVSEFLSTVHALRLLPGGDVALAAGFADDIELMRLAGGSGAVMWQRGDLEAEDMLVDGEGRIVVAGWVNAPGTILPVEDIQRLDASDGSTLWRQQFYAHTFSGAWRLGIGIDGQLLLGFTVEQSLDLFGAAGLDLATGALRWSYAPPGVGADDDRFPVGIVQSADGAIYFGGFNYLPADDRNTWTTFKLAPIAADTIFLGGFE